MSRDFQLNKMLLWALLLIWSSRVSGESALFKCDEYYQMNTLADRTDYCTVTGLHVSHSQDVVIFDIEGHQSIFKTTEFMKFYDSSVLYIPQIVFSEFRSLQVLDISYSDIIDITRNTFTYAGNLLSLDVGHNNITEITTSVFVGAKNLQRITFSFNQIKRLDEHSFNGLQLLSSLYLDANRLKELHENLFVDNSNLEKILLNKNEIEHLVPTIFSNLKRLRDIDLSENELLAVDPGIVRHALNLESLLLSQNYLKNLTLDLSGALSTLYVENNQLTHFWINCSKPIPPSFKSSCGSLQWLFIANNSITDIQNITSHSNLKVLDLSHNPIGKINISTFGRLNALERLHLKHTNLSGLTYGTFARQTNLKSLDLSENNLQHLDLDIFLPYMTNLVTFLIDGNNLTEIAGKHHFSSFPSLRSVGLSRNNFNCSYLSHIITAPFSNSEISFHAQAGDYIDDVAHISGIACSPSTNSTRDPNSGYVADLTLERYESSIEKMKLHEHQLEQHLTLMKFFIVSVAVFGLCVIIFKIVKLVPINRDSLINSISYRSTATVNTIQTNMD